MNERLDIRIKARQIGMKPYRIVCEKCNEYDALIDLNRIDTTSKMMNESLFRHTFVTPIMALIELNMIRMYTFKIRHESSCKRATFRVEDDDMRAILMGGVS